jgi:probable HAF family extracellular repeat protein
MKPSQRVQAAQDCKTEAAEPARFDVLDLGPFDNNRNDVLAINDRGQRAGVSLNPETGRIEAFRQEDEARSMLGTLGGSFSIARDLNNLGEVVGGSLTEGDENFHGFIFRNNRLYDLNEFLEPGAGWELVQALGINNEGEIIAIGCNEGHDRIVLLRPRMSAM